MTSPSQLSVVTSKLLLDLWYGDPAERLRLTDWTSDVRYDGATYTSTPLLSVDLVKDSVGPSDGSAEILAPSSIQVLNDLASGSPFPKVSCLLRELTELGGNGLGDELLTNGQFDAWTGSHPDSWTVVESPPNSLVSNDNNACRLQSLDGSLVSISQPGILTPDNSYTFTYRIFRATSGSLKILQGSTELPIDSSLGNHSVTFVADGTDFSIMRDSGITDTSIDGCVLKQVIADPQEVYTHVRGEVTSATANPQGLKGMVRLECAPPKSLLKTPLGIVVQNQCPWVFGGRGCQVAISPLREVGTLSTISGKSVTVTGLSTTLQDHYWHRGYMEREGLKIGIRDYSTGTSFELVREPPASWAGALVTLTPGCDKTIDTCRLRWDNEEHFGGGGFAIPNSHPIIEQR